MLCSLNIRFKLFDLLIDSVTCYVYKWIDAIHVRLASLLEFNFSVFFKVETIPIADIDASFSNAGFCGIHARKFALL